MTSIAASVLASERAFFDEEAAALRDEDLLIPADQIERYRRARSHPLNSPKDELFARVLPLEGKRVLDYGCGHGENACLLAACGAEVTAFDLSPVSVEAAKRRARLHGLEHKIRFDTARAGDTPYPSGAFDVVTCFGVLHHLHHDLPTIYEEIERLLVPCGALFAVEPVANNQTLRKLREILPVEPDATPDERQLHYEDLEPIKAHGFRELQLVHFYGLERLRRVVGDWARAPLRTVDHLVQRAAPPLRALYGIVLAVARR